MFFGEPSSLVAKKAYDCCCPNCGRTQAASRFAPHLEKCMGMEGNSARMASKRIASSGRSNGTGSNASTGEWRRSSSTTNNNGISPSTPNQDSDPEDNDKSSDNDWNEKPVVKKARKKRKDHHHLGSNGVVKRGGIRSKFSHQHHHSQGTLEPFLARNSHGQFTARSSSRD